MSEHPFDPSDPEQAGAARRGPGRAPAGGASEAWIAYQTALLRHGSDEPARPCAYEQALVAAARSVAPGDSVALMRAARRARPLPGTVTEAFEEWRYIAERERTVRSFYRDGGVAPAMRARAAVLEGLILGETQAISFDDVAARMHLLEVLGDQETAVPPRQLKRLAAAVVEDIDRLRARWEAAKPAPRPAAKEAPKTATERRAAVIAQLCDPETSQWSDRAIARAAGVSPQTVGNWRRKLSALNDPDEPDADQRLYHRGGKTYRMKTKKIGKLG